MSTLTPMPDGNWFENTEKRPHPWPGLEWLTTALVFNDVATAVEFYGSTLGFVPIAVLPFGDRADSIGSNVDNANGSGTTATASPQCT